MMTDAEQHYQQAELELRATLAAAFHFNCEQQDEVLRGITKAALKAAITTPTDDLPPAPNVAQQSE